MLRRKEDGGADEGWQTLGGDKKMSRTAEDGGDNRGWSVVVLIEGGGAQGWPINLKCNYSGRYIITFAFITKKKKKKTLTKSMRITKLPLLCWNLAV